MMFKSTLMSAAAVVGLSTALAGPAVAGDNPYLGQIQAVAMGWCPRGWAQLDGQLLPIDNNGSLFSLLGNTFGGDPRRDFALPDLRGRSPAGASLHSPPPPPAPALALGDKGGRTSGPILMAQLPPHTHLIQATRGDPAVGSPGAAAIPTIPDPTRASYTQDDLGTATMYDGTLGESGLGGAINFYQPSLAINYCIALTGRFPPRN